MMRVLVTGASGCVGRNVLLRTPRSWEVVAVYHRASDFPHFVTSRGLSHVRPLACDLTSPEDVRRLKAAVGWEADVALYLAANSDPARSVAEPTWDLTSNTLAMANFLERCPVKHLIYLSSGAVYEGRVGPVCPATPVNPTLPYAISKLAAEGYVRFYAEQRGTLGSYTILRFFGVYGPYESARKITTRWLTALADGQRTFSLRGDGKNLIDLMYIDDMVDGLFRLINAPGRSLTADFAAGSPMSLDELVMAMANAFGVPMTVHHEGHTAEYIQFYSVDPTMRDRVGWKPTTSLEEGVRRLRAFLSEPLLREAVS